MGIAAKGCKLERSTNGTDYVEVPGVTNIQLPIGIEELDDTAHDTVGNYRKFITSLKDLTIPAEINWVPSDSVHQALLADANSSTARYFRVKTPGGTVLVTSQFVINKLDLNMPVGEKMTAQLGLHNAGTPSFG